MFEFIKRILNAKNISELFENKKEKEVKEFEFDANKAKELAKTAEDKKERKRVEDYKTYLEKKKQELYSEIKKSSNNGVYHCEITINDIAGYPTTSEALIKSMIVSEFKERGFKVDLRSGYKSNDIIIYWN